ncbi:MAG: PAS domain S-box protein [Thermodesulforhabdaceae bacterium]
MNVEQQSMYLSLLQNAAIIVAMSAFYSLIIRISPKKSVWLKLSTGLLFGLTTIVGMNVPFRYAPGIIHDGRSIVLSIAGFFGGRPGALIPMIMAGAYRAHVGGPGVWAGLAAIVLCPLVGILFRRLCKGRTWEVSVWCLYFMGLITHAGVLACQLLIQPFPSGLVVISNIWIPMMLFFPVATTLIGLFLAGEEKRVATERELRKALTYIDNLINTANVLFVELDKSGRVLRINEAAERITGYTLEELRGKNWFEILVPREKYPYVWDMFFSIAEDGSNLPRTFENPIISKTGEERYIIWKNGFVTDDSGKFSGTISFGIDITDRKKLEADLIALRDFLLYLFTVNPAVIYTLDPVDLKVKWVSPNITELSGYDIDDAFHHKWWVDNIHPEDRDSVISIKRDILRKNHIVCEYRFRKKDGSFVWVRDELKLIKRNGEVEIVGAGIDITERRRMEEERERLQREFMQIQRLEAVGRLAAGIAHDFNNMLNVIIGYSEILLQSPDIPETEKPKIQQILDAAWRSSDLTKQLLTFARKQRFEPKIININETIRGGEKMLRKMIGEDIDLELSLGESISPVKADPVQIWQIIMNLAVNAKDAMPSGGRLRIETAEVELDEKHVETQTGPEPGRYVKLSVEDTGSGIPEDVLPYIFDPFFTTKENGKGTGLGLSTVYGIVKQLGGHISVSSEVNKGTVFSIYIPRASDAEDS